jgi:DNA-binding response OmpR family regulator
VLPKKSGYEVLQEVKENEKTSRLPIILLTNLGSLSDVEKALGLGATTYLVKADYSLDEITKKIKEILNLK